MKKITELSLAHVALSYAAWVPSDALWTALVFTGGDGVYAVYGGFPRLTASDVQDTLTKAQASGLYAFAIAIGDPEDIGAYSAFLIPKGLTRREKQKLEGATARALAKWAKGPAAAAKVAS